MNSRVCQFSAILTVVLTGEDREHLWSKNKRNCVLKHLKLVQTGPKDIINTRVMARKKSKQQGVAQKELLPGQQTISKNPVSPGDAAGGGGGDAGLDRLATRANQVASSKLIAGK